MFFGSKINSSLTCTDPTYQNKFLREMAEIYCRATDYLKNWYNSKIYTSEYFFGINLKNKDLVHQDFSMIKSAKV